ncbi:PPE family protein [Mycobacterium lepromatosis]|uniref:PPE family protein n=1 Tax=Mycobacterium lepromatosis TaxID=480418 RepID=UPI003D8020B2
MALPPEINAYRLQHGPGSAPLLAAAEAWESLQEELTLAAQEVSDTIVVIVVAVPESFAGPTSDVVVRRVQRYSDWLRDSAANASVTVDQLASVAAAYETACASVVPTLVVISNIVQTKVLQVCNWFGQFSPQIARKESEYDKMWVNNARAMLTYRDVVLQQTFRTRNFTLPPHLISDGCRMRRSSIDSFDSTSSFDLSSSFDSFDSTSSTDSFDSTSSTDSFDSTSSTDSCDGYESIGPSADRYESLSLYDPVASRAESNLLAMSSASYDSVYDHGYGYDSVGESDVCSSLGTFPPDPDQLSAGFADFLGSESDVVSMASSGLSMANGLESTLDSLLMSATAAQAAEVLAHSEAAIEGLVGSVGSGILMQDAAAEGSQVVASVGQAASVGPLRVPESWVSASQAATTSIRTLPVVGSAVTTAVSGSLEGMMDQSDEAITDSTEGETVGLRA